VNRVAAVESTNNIEGVNNKMLVEEVIH